MQIGYGDEIVHQLHSAQSVREARRRFGAGLFGDRRAFGRRFQALQDGGDQLQRRGIQLQRSH